MSTTQIDENLFSRQILTYGIEAVQRITSSSITIIGLEGGLGTEIAKNLALGGVKHIYLYDNSLITKEDLETGFYFSNDDIGKIRSNVLKSKIQDLNQYVTVYDVNDDNFINNDSILIIVNQSPKTIISYEKKFNSRTIAVFSKGCAGTVFVNAGLNHTVVDTMGENIEPVQIGSISSEGNVKCAPNHSHDYQTGDTIKIINVQGRNVEQFNDIEFKIKVESPTSFTLQNFKLNDFTFVNGTAIYIKNKMVVQHKSFEEQLKEPSFNFSFDDSELIFNSLIKYFTDSTISDDLSKTFSSEIMPVVSLIGSVAASETIKLITNKYLPVNQFWCWYEPKLIPTKTPDVLGTTSLGKLYGLDFEKSMNESSWFVVGSGAIGCELLKNLAFINVGNIYLTDPDTIEKSNLNRQFLFRPKHIGKPKSQMAATVISDFKPTIKIQALTDKVCRENQTFCDEILKKVSGVFNALDNIDARKYMDEQCLHNQKPLFESGTTGTKGNTQPVIPFLTETYSNSADPPQEKSFPICTIKSFPNQIQHTIHWAMDYFELFNRAPINVNKWIDNNRVFETGELNIISQGKEDVLNFLINLKIKSFEDCVYRAVEMFDSHFKTQIKKLLTTFPEDHKNEDGTIFWSNGKRIPKAIELDINNEHHYNFIEATSNLIAKCYQLQKVLNNDEIKEIVMKMNRIDSKSVDEPIISGVDIVLPDNKEYSNIKLISQEFEKDDDTNWHVAWVNATSNLRAINYGIPPVSKQETKGIAGRIIPAVATTTSVVSGLIVIEMIKYMLSKNNLIEDKIENYRSTYVNLADTNLVYSEPLAAKQITIAGKKYNSWTKFDYNGKGCTIETFKKHYEKLFETTLSMIVYNNAIIFADCMDDGKSGTTLMSEAIMSNNSDVDLDKNPVIITIASVDDIDLPEIKYAHF